MILYVVKSGDSVYSIAEEYGVSPETIITENDLKDPSTLVVGQCLIIKRNDIVYVVMPNDTLYSIARKNGQSINDLIKTNPTLKPPYNIIAGQNIIIRSDGVNKTPIKINGYCYETSNLEIVTKSLPYLTYLSIFSYHVQEDGHLVGINDTKFIEVCKEYRVAPLLVVTNTLDEGSFNSDLASSILNSRNATSTLIEDIISTIKNKGYRGVNIDFEYIFPKDKNSYVNFLDELNNRLKDEGDYLLTTALAPKTSSSQVGLLYEAHDYAQIGEISDFTILMTYEWGYTYGPAMAVAPIDKVEHVIEYASEEISEEKIFMGIPNYGYDFTLPYVKGRPAKSIANDKAVGLAKKKNASIEYDEQSQTPYFVYFDSQKRKHIVYFEDPRSIKAKCLLAKKYELGGLSIWTINTYWHQLYEVITNYYEIEKI